MEGSVTKWLDKKGFGFIQGDDGFVYFLHIKKIAGQIHPNIGQKVTFDALEGKKGMQAVNAELK